MTGLLSLWTAFAVPGVSTESDGSDGGRAEAASATSDASAPTVEEASAVEDAPAVEEAPARVAPERSAGGDPAVAPVSDGAAVESEERAARADVSATESKVFQLKGVYTVWGLTQRNFMLGADHPLNDASYTVQMLRLDGKAQRDGYGVRARLDLAQGWWGVDNAPNRSTAVGTDDDGNPVGQDAYNTNAMFESKGTNYAIHVDLAYGWFDLPGLPVQVRLGRQYYGVGHKIVLDMDYDGVQIEAKPVDGMSLQAWWAKVGEGRGARTLPRGVLMSDEGANADADLFGLIGSQQVEEHTFGAYALYYVDRSAQTDWTLIPHDLGYNRARHMPEVSRALAVGVTADGELPVAEGLRYAFELDWLQGRDDVANTDHAGGRIDINDGTLRGYDIYATLDQKLDIGVPLTVGVLFGMGSGDDDPTSGAGNLQRIQTMGFFPLTYVWEDSVMPDMEGISPQGLGSPVSRGYRELENTTAVQGRLSTVLAGRLTVGGTYTYIKATQPVRGFDASGAPTGAGATDLGQEIDGKISWKLPMKGPGTTLTALGGVFFPGTAAGNLIVGTGVDLQPAWELKTVAALKF